MKIVHRLAILVAASMWIPGNALAGKVSLDAVLQPFTNAAAALQTCEYRESSTLVFVDPGGALHQSATCTRVVADWTRNLALVELLSRSPSGQSHIHPYLNLSATSFQAPAISVVIPGETEDVELRGLVARLHATVTRIQKSGTGVQIKEKPQPDEPWRVACVLDSNGLPILILDYDGTGKTIRRSTYQWATAGGVPVVGQIDTNEQSASASVHVARSRRMLMINQPVSATVFGPP